MSARPPCFITESRYVENVFSLVEIVPVVAIREYLRVDVAGVKPDRRREMKTFWLCVAVTVEAVRLRSKLGGLLVALVSVEDAQRNVDKPS